MAGYDYDLFVIGGGSGGVRAARIAGSYGAKVAVAEEYRYGGTCVIRGCVPKKLFVYAGRFAHEFSESRAYGWEFDEPSFNWKTLMANKDREIDRLEVIYQQNLERAGVITYKSRAELVDTHTIHLTHLDKTVTAERILIATGGHPNIDHKVPGIEHTITSNEFLHMEELPKRIVIAGGGYVAAEFACVMNHLGVDTTIVYRGPQILRGFDHELRDFVNEGMARDGVKFHMNNVFTKIEKTDAGLVATTSDGTVLEADTIMMAIGRSPNTKGLGLEKAGVKLASDCSVIVDPYSKSSVDHIYAVGDVTNRLNLTPVAIREGHAFADTVFGGLDKKADHDLVATAIFTTPEVGTVGLTEIEARDRYRAVDIYKTQFRLMKAVMSKSDDFVMMKMIVDADTDRVLGVHVAGYGAGEMIQNIGVAVKMGATKRDFDQTVAVHPTASEEIVTMREVTTSYVRDAAE